jgi:hypothetical protein
MGIMPMPMFMPGMPIMGIMPGIPIMGIMPMFMPGMPIMGIMPMFMPGMPIMGIMFGIPIMGIMFGMPIMGIMPGIPAMLPLIGMFDIPLIVFIGIPIMFGAIIGVVLSCVLTRLLLPHAGARAILRRTRYALSSVTADARDGLADEPSVTADARYGLAENPSARMGNAACFGGISAGWAVRSGV